MSCVPEKWIPALFDAWRQRDIQFVVLRNYEQLPHAIGNDLDVLVDPGRIAEAEAVLDSVLTPLGGRVHHRAEFSPISLFFHDKNTLCQYHLDLFRDLKWRGVELLPTHEVLAGARLHNGIPVPARQDEAVLNLLTRLLYGGYVREKYKSSISTAFHLEPPGVSRRLCQALGVSGQWLAQAVRDGHWDQVERRAGRLRWLLIARTWRHPVRIAASWGADALRLMNRFRRVPGLVLVFTGPDGSGKTSVGEQVKYRLAGTFYGDYAVHLHWKPRLLSHKARQSTPFGVPCVEPHGKPVRRKWTNASYFLLHALEIIPAWYVRIRPRLFRNALVIIDRYYYDFMVDPRRYRLSVSEKWAWFFYRFVPKPDLVFGLIAPAEAIQRRKKEVSHEETERQCHAYEAVVRRLPNGRIVNVDRPVGEVAEAVVREVLDYLYERRLQADARQVLGSQPGLRL
jgi:thymidylate kinase